MTLTPEQLALRKQGLGSSDLPSVLGLSPYRSAFELWLEKTGRVAPFAGNKHTELGNLIEPVIGTLYERKAQPTSMERGTTVIGSESWMIATPDFIVTDDETRIMEAKMRSRFTMDDFGPPGTDQVPSDILCQVTWQQGVTGITAPADVAVLTLDSRDFETWRIPFDAGLFAMMVETAGRWWMEHVVNGAEPVASGDEETQEYLKEKFATYKNDSTMIANEEVELLLQTLVMHLEDKAFSKMGEEQVKVLLMQVMGSGHDRIHGSAAKISWRNQAGRQSTDWEAIAGTLQKHCSLKPQQVNELIHQNTAYGKPNRVFRVTPSKNSAPRLLPPRTALLPESTP